MLDVEFVYNRANQPVVLTPFLLMGAMSPVSIPSTLAKQLAEALTGTALSQLIRPGCPVILGSFLSRTSTCSRDRRASGHPSRPSGSTARAAPRHYGLPFRTGGGLTSSQTPDAQAAYEALMTMLPTFLAGGNFIMHTAGWLEGGLVSSYEKFVIDIEILRMLKVEFTPLVVDEASLAFGAHVEVGHGGHFLGAEHTMERFRELFYRPLLSSSANYERWVRQGGKDAAARAGEIVEKTLADYERPPIDEAVLEQTRRLRRTPAGRARRLTSLSSPSRRRGLRHLSQPGCRQRTNSSAKGLSWKRCPNVVEVHDTVGWNAVGIRRQLEFGHKPATCASKSLRQRLIRFRTATGHG